MAIELELTDTFGGDANYSWVRRARLDDSKPWRSDLSIVRAAKAWAGWTGHRCRVDRYGDMLAIYPRGVCQVLFVTYAEESNLPVAG